MEKHFNVICNRVKGRTLGKLFCKYAVLYQGHISLAELIAS